jgi:centromeric protein E
MAGTPAAATPMSKVHRNLAGTPGGSKIREEKIRVTVRMRPLNRKEQSMYDLIAWDCLDEHTIVFKNPNEGRPATSYTFGMYCIMLILLCM